MTQQQEEQIIREIGEIKGILGNGSGVLATVRQNHQDIREMKELLPKVVTYQKLEKWIIRCFLFGQTVIILLFGTGILKV